MDSGPDASLEAADAMESGSVSEASEPDRVKIDFSGDAVTQSSERCSVSAARGEVRNNPAPVAVTKSILSKPRRSILVIRQLAPSKPRHGHFVDPLTEPIVRRNIVIPIRTDHSLANSSAEKPNPDEQTQTISVCTD